jgi:hypothetical protein
MVTAEAAVLLPVLACLTGLLLSLLAVAGAQLAVTESARVVAREVARGGALQVEADRIERRWPGTRVRLRDEGDAVRVTVERPLALPTMLRSLLGAARLRAEATVAAESG